MQYCELFDQIKATLEDFDHRIVPFDKIAFRSGNDHVVQDISTRLKEVLLTNKLVIESDVEKDNEEEGKVTPIRSKHLELRKVFTFLLFNTKVDYAHEIGTLNKNVCHILKICPLLPNFLFVDVIWSCSMETFFYELLSYAPPWLSYQHYETAVESMQYVYSPYDVVDKAAKIVYAVAVSITLARNPGLDAFDIKLLDEQLPNCVAKLLLHFNNNNSHKTKLKKRALKRFMGFVVRHLLETCISCIELYRTPADIPIECEMYNSYRVVKAQPKKHRTVSPVDYNALLQKLIMNVLNTLQNNLMDIDIDTFLEWTEEEVGGGYENLQAQVGALSFELIECLATENTLKHDVCTQLQQFATKPIKFEERISSVNVGQLLNLLEDTTLTKDQLSICLNVLFAKPIVFGNDECLETIRNCVHLLSVDNCKTIIDFIAMDTARTEAQTSGTESADDDDSDSGDGDYDALVDILHQAFANFSCKEKLALLVYRERQLAASNKCVSLFELPNFNQRSNVYWNSFGNNFEPEKFIMFCFENSHFMWQKYFRMVLYNEHYVESFLSACIATKGYAKRHHMANIRAAMKSTELVLSPTFSDVLCKLFHYYFDKAAREQFIKYTLVKINKHLAADRYNVVYVLIDLLDQLSKQSQNLLKNQLGFANMTPYVILNVANVMNQTRWTMYTFNIDRAQLVTLCRKFLIAHVEKYARQTHPVVRRYLCKQAVDFKFTRFTKYYLQKLTSAKAHGFTRYVLPSLSRNVNDLSAFVETILRCSEGELHATLGHSLYRKQLFNIINVTASTVAGMDNETVYENYMYLFKNLVSHFVQRLKRIRKLSKTTYRSVVERIIVLVTTPVALYPRLLNVSTEMLAMLMMIRGVNTNLLLRRVKMLPACKAQEAAVKRLSHILTFRNR